MFLNFIIILMFKCDEDDKYIDALTSIQIKYSRFIAKDDDVLKSISSKLKISEIIPDCNLDSEEDYSEENSFNSENSFDSGQSFESVNSLAMDSTSNAKFTFSSAVNPSFEPGMPSTSSFGMNNNIDLGANSNLRANFDSRFKFGYSSSDDSNSESSHSSITSSVKRLRKNFDRKTISDNEQNTKLEEALIKNSTLTSASSSSLNPIITSTEIPNQTSTSRSHANSTELIDYRKIEDLLRVIKSHLDEFFILGKKGYAENNKVAYKRCKRHYIRCRNQVFNAASSIFTPYKFIYDLLYNKISVKTIEIVLGAYEKLLRSPVAKTSKTKCDTAFRKKFEIYKKKVNKTISDYQISKGQKTCHYMLRKRKNGSAIGEEPVCKKLKSFESFEEFLLNDKSKINMKDYIDAVIADLFEQESESEKTKINSDLIKAEGKFIELIGAIIRLDEIQDFQKKYKKKSNIKIHTKQQSIKFLNDLVNNNKKYRNGEISSEEVFEVSEEKINKYLM